MSENEKQGSGPHLGGAAGNAITAVITGEGKERATVSALPYAAFLAQFPEIGRAFAGLSLGMGLGTALEQTAEGDIAGGAQTAAGSAVAYASGGKYFQLATKAAGMGARAANLGKGMIAATASGSLAGWAALAMTTVAETAYDAATTEFPKVSKEHLASFLNATQNATHGHEELIASINDPELREIVGYVSDRMPQLADLQRRMEKTQDTAERGKLAATLARRQGELTRSVAGFLETRATHINGHARPVEDVVAELNDAMTADILRRQEQNYRYAGNRQSLVRKQLEENVTPRENLPQDGLGAVHRNPNGTYIHISATLAVDNEGQLLTDKNGGPVKVAAHFETCYASDASGELAGCETMEVAAIPAYLYTSGDSGKSR